MMMEKTVLFLAFLVLFTVSAQAYAPQVAYNRFDTVSHDRMQNDGDCTDDPDPCDSDAIPSIFFDCNACDLLYLRQEINFVNHVRDKEDSDVFVMITNMRTGGGGQAYTIQFMGQGRFEDLEQTILYNSQPGNTPEEVRQGLTQRIMLGLMPYMARTSAASQLRIRYTEQGGAVNRVIDDPWNFWVFRINGSGYMNLEASRDIYRINSSITAERTTEDWRIRSQVYGNRDLRRFKDDAETIENQIDRAGAYAIVVKSLSPHWSLGFSSSANTSSFNNIDFGLSTGPAVEYNIYPYDEATRREFTFAYRLSYAYQDYTELTIYDKMTESLMRHSLEARLRLKETWGETYATVEGSQYFHDPSKNRLEVSGNISLRLMRGLSLSLASGLELIHDQIYLAKGDADLEDLLLQRRQLATTYEITSSIGLSYTFGSMYNNVVNTRL